MFLLAVGFLVFGTVGVGHSTSIIGGSSLIDTDDVMQLESWLGEDNLALTKIFSKSADGASAGDFHEHVDNQGRTFTLIEVINTIKTDNITHVETTTDVRIIGGYASQSWTSTGGYNDHAAPESFLFNLTSATLYSRTTNGHYMYNDASYGPTWGGGHDLKINDTLSGGVANIGFSYGDTSKYGDDDYQKAFAGSKSSWTIGELEVFTIASDSSPVPEPSTMILLGAGLLGLAGFGRKKEQ